MEKVFLGGIVEREFSDDDEFVAGPVVAQPEPVFKVIPKEKRLDPAIFEQQKLEWTEDVNELDGNGIDSALNSNEIDDQVRFDFKGNICEYSEDSSLYHHGEQPTKPGYTLQELIHLSKSTVPSQRLVAFQTLSCIVQRIIQLEYEKSMLFYEQLMELDLFIVLRVGLDSTHESVLYAALHCLAIAFGFPNSFEIWDTLALLKYGHKTIALERDSLDAFVQKALGRPIAPTEEEIDTTYDGISQKCKDDATMGLLMSNVIARFNYILQNMNTGKEALKKILYILSIISKHSASSSEDILAADGLIDNIRSHLQKVVWPCNDPQELEIVGASIRLFTFLCQSSREAAEALQNYKVIEDMVKFVSCPPQKDDAIVIEKRYITGLVYQLLAVVFGYGIGGSIIDSYRTLFFDSLAYSIQHLPDDEFSLGSLCRMSTMALISFDQEVDAGGYDDVFLMMVESVLEIVHDKTPRNVLLPILQFLLVYVDQAQRAVAQTNVNISRRVQEVVSKLPLESARDLYLSHWYKPMTLAFREQGVGITNWKRIDMAKRLLEISVWGDYTSLLLDFYRYYFQRTQIDSHVFKGIVYADTILESLKYAKEKNVSKPDDWILIFGQGANHFLDSWIRANNELKKRNVDCDTDMVVTTSLTLVSRLLPGDDDIMSHTLRNVFMSSVWLSKDHKIPELAFGELISDSRTRTSTSVRRTTRDSMPFCMYHIQDYDTSLPISPDWIYSLARSFYFANQKCKAAEVIAWLRMVDLLETAKGLEGMSTTLKLYNLMFTFMLYDTQDEEIFKDQEVSLLLESLLQKLTSGPSTAETIQDPSFFNFYEDLLDHFDGVSYGDKVFAMYLFVPLTNNYPIDFRFSFWSKLYHQLQLIKLEAKELPWQCMDPYIEPLERNKNLISIFGRARLSNKITPERNPALWKIVESVVQ